MQLNLLYFDCCCTDEAMKFFWSRTLAYHDVNQMVMSRLKR
jgi:hypothetical protein